MAENTTKRSVYHSILTKEGWAVMLEQAALSLHETQREAEREATALVKKNLVMAGLPRSYSTGAMARYPKSTAMEKIPAKHPADQEGLRERSGN